MNDRKYPLGFFVTGVLITAFFRLAILMITGLILVALGVFWKPLLFVGALIVAFDLLVAFSSQLRLRRITLSDSDDPEFKEFQNAILSRNWRENIKNLAQKISEEEDDEDPQN